MRQKRHLFAPLLIAGLSLTAGCAPAKPAAIALHPLFGPVLGNEVIAGRAEEGTDEGPVPLLVGERAVLRIDLGRRVAVRHDIPMPIGEACWGLARLRDGSMWALKGRRTLVQLTPDGEIARSIDLAESHFGVFGNGDTLLYQKAEFIAPAQALYMGPPGNAARAPFGSLRTRSFALARTSVAALNFLSCGASLSSRRPCWFPEEAAVMLFDDRGRFERVPLAGVPVVTPEVLLTSDAPARPVRDAYVDRDGLIWVLASGTPPVTATSGEVTGGWLLARYDAVGGRHGSWRLPEPVRLILRANSERAWLLTGSGMVVEVTP